MWFVGRQDELSALHGEAAAVRVSGTRFVLLSGERGVGKTALAARFVEQAAIDGFRTARIVCAAVPHPHPLRPWQMLLRGLAAGDSAGRYQPAEQVTEVADRLVDLAATRPLLVVLDDLQRADATVLGPLNYLADLRPAVPLLLLGLLRDPSGSTIDRSTMELARPAAHLPLRGLPAVQAGELITRIVGRDLPSRTVADLTRRCDGNPALLADVCRQIDPRQLPETGMDRLAIDWPNELRALANEAIESLDDQTRQVLAAASVIGREFDLGILERLVPAGADPVRAIDAALARSVLTWRHGEVYAFTQALVREVLYDSLGVIRRATLHETAATVLAGFRHQVGDRGPTVAEFAHHLVAAAVLGGEERLDLAITYATAAGTAAMLAGEHHDACAHHETALALAVRAQWPPGPLGRLTVALGRAALAAGDHAKGRAALRAAARQARQAGDPELLAETALGHGPRAAVGLTAPSPELAGLLTEASDADLPADHAIRVAARLAVELADGTDRPVAVRLVTPPQGAPETCRPRPLVEFLIARALVTRDPDAARCAVRAALDLGDPLLVCQARLSLAAAALAAGGLSAARDELERVARTAPAVRHPLATWWGACAEATLAFVAGRLAEAEAATVAAREAGRGLPGGLADLAYAAQLGAVRAAQGRCVDLAPLLADLTRDGSPPGWLLALSARVALDQGNREMAAAVVHEALADREPWTAGLLVDVAVALDDPAVLAVLDEILDRAGTPWLVTGPPILCAGPVALLRARLRLARDDPATAEELLRTVEPALAVTVWQPVAQRLRAEAGTHPVRSGAGGPGGGNVDGLTPREQEVLDLALAGTSTREIAALLFISERTAESHLANIYRKLNVRSRVELLARHLG